MNYRADIQLLRGLSVLLVILYHLQLGIVKSGFLGVDIFFVISGFLMAVLYYPNGNVKEHAFSKQVIKSFFARRLRRLLPAYFATIASVLFIGFFCLNNNEFRDLSHHSIYASVMLPNIPYWLQASYFDAQSFRPLLHLWSVGVELQFYLLVPIIFAVFNHSRKWIIIAALISLIVCMIVSSRSSNTAFFMLPLRFWEFMFGFLAAMLFTDNGNSQHKYPAIGLIALGSIITIALLDANFDLRHPGPAALAVCLATSIILIIGLPNKLLNSVIGKSFVTLGKYSYSAYLCHFPIILFFAYRPFQGALYDNQSLLSVSLVIVIISISSMIMYHLIEQPLRKSHSRLTRPAVLILTVIISICIAYGLNQFQKSLYTTQQINIVNAAHDRTFFRCGTSYGLLKPFAKSCDLTNGITESRQAYLLVGNSHADAIKEALSESAMSHNASVRLWKENFPLGWSKTTADNVISEAKKFNINTIILHTSKKTLRIESLRELLRKSQDQEISVVYIDPVPTWLESVPSLIWKEAVFGQTRPAKGRGQHHLENTAELQELNAVIGEKHKNFTRFYTANWLCRPYCQLTDKNGVPLYYDSHHLNLTGARQLSPMFDKIFK